MGIFSKLFGSKNKAPKQLERIEYDGFQIEPNSQSESGQYRIAGKIYKQYGEETKTYNFIRSDVVANKAEADSLMVQKSKVFIDQMGDSIF
jgi:hypothetical protein